MTKVVNQHIIAIYQQKTEAHTRKGGGIMAKQEKGYTPEQIKDAEKLCQLMQKVPDAKRQMFSVSVLAYMNGFEAGIALGRDMVQAQTTG